MAKIEGGVPIAGFVSPTDESDTYAVTDEKYQRGGYRSVDNYTEMQNIPEDRRSIGMLVFVREEKKVYRLEENGFVIPPGGGEGGGDSVFAYESPTEPTDPELNELWLNTSTGVISVYKEVTNDDGSTTNKWVSQLDSLEGLDFENVLYNNNTPTTAAVGGVPAGTRFENKTMSEVFNMLFYPYQEPTISTLTTNYDTIREIGSPTENTITITWNTTNQDNIKAGSINITVDGTTVNGDTELNKSGTETFSITPLNKQTDGTVPVVLSLVSTKDKTISKTTNITWLSPIYYGTSDSTTVDNDTIVTFSKLLANSYKRTYEFPGGGYKYVVFPASMGNANVFFNADNNLPVPMEKIGNVDVTNVYGVTKSYVVYRSTNILGGSIKITFG